MLHDKQKVMCHTLIIVLAFPIVMFGSYYSSSVSAFSLQSPIHHHKVFDNKQESDSSSSSDTKRSDNSNNNGNSNNNDDNNKNNNQGTNDDSNTGTGKTFKAVEPAKSGEQQHGSGENIAPIEIVTPKSKTMCEQGSDCTDQQGSSDRDLSTTDAATTKQDYNTPFVLSLPFP